MIKISLIALLVVGAVAMASAGSRPLLQRHAGVEHPNNRPIQREELAELLELIQEIQEEQSEREERSAPELTPEQHNRLVQFLERHAESRGTKQYVYKPEQIQQLQVLPEAD